MAITFLNLLSDAHGILTLLVAYMKKPLNVFFWTVHKTPIRNNLVSNADWFMLLRILCSLCRSRAAKLFDH